MLYSTWDTTIGYRILHRKTLNNISFNNHLFKNQRIFEFLLIWTDILFGTDKIWNRYYMELINLEFIFIFLETTLLNPIYLDSGIDKSVNYIIGIDIWWNHKSIPLIKLYCRREASSIITRSFKEENYLLMGTFLELPSTGNLIKILEYLDIIYSIKIYARHDRRYDHWL